MWLPGHFAVALIMSLPLLLMVKEKRMLAIAYVAFFAVFLDFLHLGQLRMISHSLIGLTVLLVLMLGLSWAMFRPRPILLAIGAVSAFSHLAVDLFLGNITPYYPLNTVYWGHLLGPGLDVPLEVAAMALTLIILLALIFPSGSIGPVRSFPRAARLNLQAFLIPFVLMTAFEGGYYLLFNFRAAPGVLSGALVVDFLLLFIGFSLLVMYTLEDRYKPSIDQGREKRWRPVELE